MIPLPAFTLLEDLSVNGNGSRCPRCGEGRLVGWNELSDEERVLARRLPAAGYSLDERKARHRWCQRCWFEETGDTTQHA